MASVIIGARTMDQFEGNMGAATLDLSADELRRLGEASTPRELYPYRFLDAYVQR